MFSRLYSWVPFFTKTTFYSTKRSATAVSQNIAVIGAVVGLVSANLALADRSGEELPQRDCPSRKEYKYVICGGGVAAQEALDVFLEEEQAGHVLLVSPEWRRCDTSRFMPVENKTPTKESGPFQKFLHSLSSLSWTSLVSQQPEIVIGPSVRRIDPFSRTVNLNDGTSLKFEKCLIALGSTVPPVPAGKVVSHNASNLVGTAQSQEDWERIHRVIHDIAGTSPMTSLMNNSGGRAHITVVGGGWMSAIIGQALVKNGADVTFSNADPFFLARCLPKYIASDIRRRLVWLADGGVDTLAYSAVRYIVAREPLNTSQSSFEAEVHAGTVFDAFSIVDFRTDRVIFAPTLAPAGGGIIDAPGLTVRDGAFTTNSELAAASDVYVAGAALNIDDSASARSARWSADFARSTGRHAAYNMLGARRPYSYDPRFVVELPALNLAIVVVGDVNGSHESFGYFVRDRSCGPRTCGGSLERGVLFCVRAAPLRFRGASQELIITGIALWDGAQPTSFPDLLMVQDAAASLLNGDPLSRMDLETVMDRFATEFCRISMFDDIEEPNSALSHKLDSIRSDDSEPNLKTVPETGGLKVRDRDDGKQFKPLTTLRKPSSNVLWRRHQPARTVPLREEEMLWILDDWVGSVSPAKQTDKRTQAYIDLLKRSTDRSDNSS